MQLKYLLQFQENQITILIYFAYFFSSSKISLFENSPTVSETNTDFYQSILFQ